MSIWILILYVLCRYQKNTTIVPAICYKIDYQVELGSASESDSRQISRVISIILRQFGATVRLRRADLDCLFEKRLSYSKEERIIKLVESKAGASTEEELNEDIADKYVSKKQACDLLGVCNATAKRGSLQQKQYAL